MNLGLRSKKYSISMVAICLVGSNGQFLVAAYQCDYFLRKGLFIYDAGELNPPSKSGLVFTLIAIIQGSISGRDPFWNTWWTWESRA